MSPLLLVTLYGLAFASAVLASAGRPSRFAVLMLLFGFMVSVIYFAVLLGIFYPMGLRY